MYVYAGYCAALTAPVLSGATCGAGVAAEEVGRCYTFVYRRPRFVHALCT